MRIISWNCRGLGNPWAVPTLNNLIKEKGCNLVFLMKTRPKEAKMMRMRYKGDLSNIIGVDCCGKGKQKAGGLVAMLNNSIKVNVLSLSINHIDMEVSMEGSGQK
ncbi:hypothetical protein AHAS_Ahas09G0161200 [Arachis hypogaea]